ncbi:hypothetical protein B0T25DRAFT_534463, partial [Lasiosphaeria hispida]
AAHKAKGTSFRHVLGGKVFPETLFVDCARRSEAEPDEIQQQGLGPCVRDSHHKMVAKVLCQAYHYMIISGLAYGYVSSGDCMVFLTIPHDTPDILLAYLVHDFGNTQEAQQTFVAQLATLVLLALKAEVPPAQWILNAEQTLPRWLPKSNKMAGDLQFPGFAGGALSLPRPPPPPTPSCRGDIPAIDYHQHDDDNNDDNNDNAGSIAGPRDTTAKQKKEGPPPPAAASMSDTAASSRGTRASGSNSAPFCTQACLLSLCRQGALDPGCPNTPIHGRQGRQSHHPVSALNICLLVRDQLAYDLDQGCECLDKYGMFGATGVLFKITTSRYGYTFVAKGVQAVDADTLEEEACIYSHCRDLQGIFIPVHLGNINLVHPYPLRSLALVHSMMFLSWAGSTLDACILPAGIDPQAKTDTAVEALTQLGIEYYDLKKTNLTWNEEVGRVMIIDFNMARIYATGQKRKNGTVLAGMEKAKRVQ